MLEFRKRVRLGDVLIEKGLITQEQLEKALSEQKEKGTLLGETLVNLGYVSQDNIIDILTEQLGVEYVDLRKYEIEEDAVHLISEPIARKYRLIPIAISKKAANVLIVAMADPMDIMAIDDVSIVTNMQVEPVLSTSEAIEFFLDKAFGKQQASAIAEQFKKEQGEVAVEEDAEEASRKEDIENSPIVQLVKNIIEQAARQRTSDIHIEPFEYFVKVRYRIDGNLREIMTYDKSLFPAMIARIKILAGMDIAEKRKPQDGRMSVMVDRREYDIRISSIPTVHGEKIVMRISSKLNLTRDIKELGLDQKEMATLQHMLAKPYGIMFVTGPTGSGKSTTLYTALSELNTEGVNIITVEDPVEANLAGINQVQTNPKAGLTFASALRSILRQDPDIIMIGEIRDQETANIAVEASITGHLVVSTLHTNSAASTITRLADMDIESYMIADAVVGVIAQRLLRRVCPDCKKMVPLTEFEKEEMHIRPEYRSREILVPQANVGGDCMRCGGSGYQGRVGIYEIMPMSNMIKRIIIREGSAEEIENQAIREGMKTLVTSANQYVLQGITTIEEVHRVAYGEE